MTLTKNEIHELKVGNTIKALVGSRAIGEGANGKIDYKKCIGKVFNVTERHVGVLGYFESEYKVKEITIPIELSKISRSRITGDASKVVNSYFKKFVEYRKQKLAYEDKMRQERERLDNLKREVNSYENQATDMVQEINTNKLPANVVIFKKLSELNNSKYSGASGYSLHLYKQPNGGFTIVSISDRLVESDYKNVRFEAEYDYNTYLEGDNEDFQKEINRLWHSPVKLTNKDLQGKGTVDTVFNGETDGGHKSNLRVDYTFNFPKPLRDTEINKIVKFVERNCFHKSAIKPTRMW